MPKMEGRKIVTYITQMAASKYQFFLAALPVFLDGSQTGAGQATESRLQSATYS